MRMKLNEHDTFLIGHARRMRECRKRQRQQDSMAYTNRVSTQQRQYRLHIHKLESIIRLRKANRERQQRYRLNHSNEQKNIRQNKDRKNKNLKRKQQQLNQYNNIDEKNKSISSNILNPEILEKI
jgi:ribonuclease BN (tRNA processing enzyme)